MKTFGWYFPLIALDLLNMSTDLEFCFLCQDTSKVLGHSTINCPNKVCKKCGAKGHTARECSLYNLASTSNTFEPVKKTVDSVLSTTVKADTSLKREFKEDIYETIPENLVVTSLAETSFCQVPTNDMHENPSEPPQKQKKIQGISPVNKLSRNGPTGS